MNELKILKTKLEKELDIINQALRIQEEYSKNSEIYEHKKPVLIDSDDVEKTILNINKEFTANDVYIEIKNKYEGIVIGDNKTTVANALHKLHKEGKLRYARERSGRKPAIYVKTIGKHN